MVWKSIIWGRSLFCDGFKWKVGNDKQVYINEDPWLMGESDWKPPYTKKNLKNKRVEAIINTHGSWKENIITESFPPCDVDTILSMPKRNLAKEDEIIWRKDPKGKFSVKSAYNLAIQIEAQGSASESDSTE